MRAFFAAGGRLIDSSPMYGSSQEVIGYGLKRLGYPKSLFAATKVWTSSGSEGPAQVEESRRLWTIPKFDLLLVHNLLAWEQHLPMLFAMKAKGQEMSRLTIGPPDFDASFSTVPDFDQIHQKVDALLGPAPEAAPAEDGIRPQVAAPGPLSACATERSRSISR